MLVRPGDVVAERQIREVAQLARERGDFDLVGATRSTDGAAIEAMRRRTGFAAPIALGVAPRSVAHYGIERAGIRVIDREGRVVARDLVALRALLGG